MRFVKFDLVWFLGFALAALTASPFAHAKLGGSSGGGGSYVVIDGRTRVSDPFYAGRPVSQIEQITPVSYGDFPKELLDYMSQTQWFLGRLASSFEIDAFFDEHVTNSDQRYFLVPKSRESNVPCERYLPILNRPVEAHFQYGCTFHGDTYLFVDEWKQASTDEQAFALLHERLWAYRPDADQKDIAHFVGWAERFERRFVEQFVHGDRTPLPEEEIKGFAEFFDAGEKLFPLGAFKAYTVLNGGGLLLKMSSDVEIDSKSFVGLGSVIDPDTGKLKIRNSVIIGSLIIGSQNGMELSDSQVTRSILQARTVDHSKISFSDLADRDSASQFHYATISETDSNEDDLEINGSESAPVRIDGFTIRGVYLSLADPSSGVDTDPNVFGDLKMIVDEGTSLRNVFIGTAMIPPAIHFGKRDSLDHLWILLDDSVQKPTHPSLTVENDSRVENGVLVFQNDCRSLFGETNVLFSIGQAGSAFQKDLGGKQLILHTGWNCSAALQ